MKEFIEEHTKLCIVLGVLLVLFIALFIWRQVRIANGSFKSGDDKEVVEQNTEQQEVPQNTSIQEDVVENPESSYTASLGINKDKGDGRVTVKPKEEEPETETEVEDTTPNYPTELLIFDHTGVPKTNVDGSSYQDYLKNLTVNDFDTDFGSRLTKKDRKTKKRVLVGVEQNKDDYVKGDLQSVGWLINNLAYLDDNTAIKFTNLHLIDNIDTDGVALFCSYDWYSAFGLKDTMVLLVDNSGTLKASDFEDGDIFSVTVYAHNVKVERVNGYNVVCLQYEVFDEN